MANCDDSATQIEMPKDPRRMAMMRSVYAVERLHRDIIVINTTEVTQYMALP